VSFLPSSIRARVLILAVLPVLAIVGLGFGYFLLDRQLKSDAAQITQYRTVQNTVGRLERAVTDFRRIGTEYNRKPSASEIDNFTRATTNVEFDLKALRGIVDEKYVIGEIEGLAGEIERIKTSFGELVTARERQGLNAESGAIGAYTKARLALQSRLDKHSSNATLSPSIAAMHALFEAVGAYRAEPTKVNQDRTVEAIGRFDSALGRTFIEVEVLDLIREDKANWVAAYETLIAADQASRAALAKIEINYASGVDRAATITASSATTENMFMATIEARNTFVDRLIYGAIGALSLLFLVLGLGISRSIVKPLGQLNAAMERLGKGDTSIEPHGTRIQNEIGTMARAVVVFRDAMRERERLASSEAESLSASESRRKAVEQLIDAFRSGTEADLLTVASINDQLGVTASSLSQLAKEATSKAGSAASAAEDASINVSTVATAATQLTRSIEEISQQVGRTTEMVSRASDVANAATGKVGDLAIAAQEIGNVVSLIEQIAGQTNLLALNATIEAARAGEAGRGFAVVAQEVKTLATQTAQATAEISSRIAAVRGSTEDAVEAINEIAGIMRDVSHFATSIASAVQEQEAATSEINRNVAEVADGSRSVLANIVEVNSAATGTNNAASEVSRASIEAGNKGIELRQRIETFLSDVAAA
jgi:methyl-accepting chemotaxis protein